MARKSESARPGEPHIENRRARHDYFIDETIECGIKLTGTEIKSIREGQVSLAEGYVRATDAPLSLTLHGVHIAEYPKAGPAQQHNPTRPRALLAHAREIRKLADRTRVRGTTLVPLKIIFVRGRAKVIVGVARGKKTADKRQDLIKKEARREMDRAMTRRG